MSSCHFNSCQVWLAVIVLLLLSPGHNFLIGETTMTIVSMHFMKVNNSIFIISKFNHFIMENDTASRCSGTVMIFALL